MASDSKPVGGMKTVFDYSIRVSPRAKCAKLQIKPYGGLEVVIPLRFPRKAVPELVSRHAQWIELQMAKNKQRFAEPCLPTEIQLVFDNSCWPVAYDFDSTEVNQLVIVGDSYEDKVWQLRNWVRQKAWFHLPPLLDQLARQTTLNYKKISIRSQKTRWGSCSSSGTISVNDQLLFLPRDTAAYLMIHELCHT
ncbi:MAG: putative metal-dependent hydrolase, partial [Gammaproteobacteria bacterium]